MKVRNGKMWAEVGSTEPFREATISVWDPATQVSPATVVLTLEGARLFRRYLSRAIHAIGKTAAK